MTREETIERGIALLSLLEHAELPLAEVMDRIELVTSEPHLQQAIITRAEEEGVIERDGVTIRPRTHEFLRFSSDVRTKEGEFSCRRCGASCRTGYFIVFEDSELGAFGSSCIRKVTGRE